MHGRFLTALRRRRRVAAVLDVVDTVSVVGGRRSVVGVGGGVESCGGEVALVEEAGGLFVVRVAVGEEGC